MAMTGKFAGALALTIALTGCKALTEARTYSTDIFAVAEGDQLPAQFRLNLDMPSLKHCNEHAEAVLTALAEHFAEVTGDGCEDIGGDTILKADAVSIMHRLGEDSPEPYAITVAINPTEAGAEIYLIADPKAPGAIWNRLPEDVTDMVSLPDRHLLRLRVTNDGGGPITMSTAHSYLNRTPVIEQQSITIERRDWAQVWLSNVANAVAIDSGKPVLVARIKVEAEGAN